MQDSDGEVSDLDEKQREGLRVLGEYSDVIDRVAEARNVSRRKVLAGLATAGLGISSLSGSVSAADTSSGTIGVAGDEMDFVIDELRDPGGDVVFDVDDTGVVQSERGFSFPSVDTDELNRIKWIDTESASTAQSIIDQAQSDAEFGNTGRVAFYPGETYTMDGELIVRDGVTLALNNVQIQPSGDFNSFYVEPGARLVGPGEIKPQFVSGYSSDAIVLDSGRAGQNYYSGGSDENFTAVVGPILMKNGDRDGTGLALRTGGGNYMSKGTVIWGVDIVGFNEGLLADAQDGFINALTMKEMYWSNNIIGIDHQGSNAFGSIIHGQMQINASHDYGIRSQVSNGGLIYRGGLHDPGNATTAAVDGNHLTIVTQNNLDSSVVNFGTGTTLNGLSQQALGGSSPTASDYAVGDEVEDTDNPGTFYKLLVDGTWDTR